MGKWEEIGEKLLSKLNGLTDELAIKEACVDVMTEYVINPGLDAKSPLKVLRKLVKGRFPELMPTEVKPDGYYFTKSGTGSKERFEHLALWYLTEFEKGVAPDRWEVVGDEARQIYWSNLKELTAEKGKATKASKAETSETSEKHRQKVEDKPTKPIKTEQPKLTTEKLENAIIDALELDEETKGILRLALSHSGLDLAEFMQRAIKTYANTITGKIRRLEEDSLENVPTEKLKNDPKYSTYPGRAEEMVRRAIEAIKIYNSEIATEPKQRWIITQSLLSELTGSRGSVVQTAMQKYADDINDHHQKYPEFFNEYGTLKQYFNRKRGVEIRDEIDLVKLVPNE